MAEEGIRVKNKQVLFKNYVSGFPKDSDMYVTSESTITLKLPEGGGSNGVVLLVKNLYLSCDPYMRLLMQNPENSQGLPFNYYTPGSVCILLPPPLIIIY